MAQGEGAWGSFADGAMSGVRLMSDIQQRKTENARNARLDEENTRRYTDSVQHRDKLYDDKKAEDEGVKDAAAFKFAMDNFIADPKMANVDVNSKQGAEEFMKRNPELTHRLIKNNPRLREEALKNPDVDPDDWNAGFMPMDLSGPTRAGQENELAGKGKYAFMLNVRDEDGNRLAKPWSKTRGTDDPVSLVSSEEIMSAMANTAARYGYDGGSAIAAQKKRSELAKAQSLMDRMPGAGGGLASAVPQAPVTTAPGQPAVMSAAPGLPAAQPPAGSTSLSNAVPVAAGAVASPTDLASMPARQQMLESEQKVAAYADISTRAKERAATASVKFKKMLDPNSIKGAALRDTAKTGDSKWSIFQSAVSPESYNENRTEMVKSGQFTPDEITQLDTFYSSMPGGTTFEPVSAAAGKTKEVTQRQVISDKSEVTKTPPDPAKKPELQASVEGASSRRSGGATRQEVRDFMELQTITGDGKIDMAETLRFKRTRQFEKSDLKSIDPAHDLYDNGVLVKRGVPKLDHAAVAAQTKLNLQIRKDALDYADTRLAQYGKDSKTGELKFKSADLWDRVGEAAVDLGKKNISIDPSVLYDQIDKYNEVIAMYVQAARMDTKEGWGGLRAAIQTKLKVADAVRHPKESPTVTKSADGKMYHQGREVVEYTDPATNKSGYTYKDLIK